MKVLDSNASYLAWVDINALGMNVEDFCKYLRELDHLRRERLPG
ncbi:hypothetical protein [Lactobacillus delbrueckii]|nr:hypothetical protein [Lactobacillus delbrueckii]